MEKGKRERNKRKIWIMHESSYNFGDPFALLKLCTEPVIPKSDLLVWDAQQFEPLKFGAAWVCGQVGS